MKEYIIRYVILLSITIAVLFFILCFIGCKTVEKQVYVDRDVKVVERDTFIQIQPDSASITALMECDSTNNVIMRQLQTKPGERIVPKVVYKDRVLSVDCHEDSLREVIHIQDSIIATREHTTETLYVRRRNGYDKFVSVGFWVLLVINIVVIYLRLKFKHTLL